MGRSVGRKGIGGFKTHRKNVSLAGSDNSSVENAGDVSAANTTYPSPLKPFITEEMAEKIFRAVAVIRENTTDIIDTTNSLKSAVV